MSDLATPINTTATMSSLDLLELVNSARVEWGEPEVRRADFTARCKDELEGEYYETFVVRNPRGPSSDGLMLTRDQCMYVLMRESKAVRRAVAAKLNALAVPQSLPEALRLAADLAEKAEVLQIERDEAVRTKAQIGSRREASAMATASKASREAERLRDELGHNARHATITAVEGATGKTFAKNAYVALRRWCKQRGVSAEEVVDARYGTVKAWPAGAWLDAFGVDLRKLFSGRSA